MTTFERKRRRLLDRLRTIEKSGDSDSYVRRVLHDVREVYTPSYYKKLTPYKQKLAEQKIDYYLGRKSLQRSERIKLNKQRIETFQKHGYNITSQEQLQSLGSFFELLNVVMGGRNYDSEQVVEDFIEVSNKGSSEVAKLFENYEKYMEE